MSTISREQQKQILIETASHVINRDNTSPYSENLRELARIALASLEAEAVCVIDQSNLDYLKSGSDADVWPASRKEMGDVLLYRSAPPAPVSVPEWTNEQCLEFLSIAFRHAEIKGDLELDDIRLGVKMVNGSRAAMLQGADGTLTNEGTIPVTQFKPVADLYGLTSPTGGETSFTFDAVEARDFIDGGWSCQEYVELGRYQEALTDHSEGDLDMVRPVMFIDGNLLPGDAEKLKAAIEEFNHSGEPTIMIAGNSPVIPDGWVLVPIEPTEDMIVNGFESEPDESFSDEKEWEAYDAMSGCQQAAHRAKLCWEAMISAAPKPTVR
ncbi:hypothetical protein ACLIVV_004115 [Enterobacter roggenkampii]|uniref:hypothetical protein n=1 Tax=Enterobacter roggenkampii TaxID=1812935 RepID=UPI003D6E388D